MMDLLESAQLHIVTKVADALGVCKQLVVVVRRTQDLKGGELSIPLAPLGKAWLLRRPLTGAEDSAAATRTRTPAACGDHVVEIATNLAKLDWADCPLPISHVTIHSHDLRLHVKHGHVLSRVCQDLARPEVLLSPPGPRSQLVLHLVSKATDVLDLVALRTTILAQHIERLAQANGFHTSYAQCPLTDSRRRVLQRFGYDDGPSFTTSDDSRDYSSEVPCDGSGVVTAEVQQACDSKKANDDIWQRLTECPYKQNETETETPCQIDGDRKTREKGPMSIDLRRYLEDQNLPVGQHGYSPNIKGILLRGDRDETLDVVHRLSSHDRLRRNQHGHVNTGNTSPVEISTSHSLCNASLPVYCHVVPHTLQFHAQQVDLTWRLARGLTNDIRQCHVVHGSVKATDSQGHGVTLESYLEKRKSEMREASVMKYGPKVKDVGWDDVIEALTIAVIRFEVLGTSCRNELKVCLRGQGGGVDGNKGVFVMYNGARLATLERHFQEAVERGVYPALPPVNDVDFSLLGEGEWLLLWKHLVPYATMVRSTTSALRADKVTPTVLTHKVCGFLHDLCRDLSAYYSHTHVLQEPRPHLLPLMFVRLHLLRALNTVFTHALSLINIKPVTQI